MSSQARYANSDPRFHASQDISLGAAAYRLPGEPAVAPGPLHSPDGRFTMVADITILDRPDVIARLGFPPEQAAMVPDTDLLLRAWMRWGIACLDWLNADMAIAVWDHRRAALTLARDVLGQRPLFYHRTARHCAFATMPAGLLALPDVAQQPDLRALSSYVRLLDPPGQHSFFKDVLRVRPGTAITIKADQVHQHAFWPPPRERLVLSGPRDYEDAVEEVLDRSVAAHIGAVGSLGCHLSAGLDSAAVMASAVRQLRPGQSLTGFTAVPPPGFDAKPPHGRFLDEAALASRSAKAFPNVDHVLVPSNSVDPTTLWDRAFHLFQAPLPNPCNYTWVAEINDAARARARRTALADGSDGEPDLQLHRVQQVCEPSGRRRAADIDP